MLTKYLSVSLAALRTVLNVPTLLVSIKAVQMYADEKEGVGSDHVIVGVVTLAVHLALYLHSDNFLFCFFPNRRVPWGKPTANTNFVKYVGAVLFALLYCFNDPGTQLLLIFFILPVKLFNFSLIWWSAPYYSKAVDFYFLSSHFAAAYMYTLVLLKSLMGSQGDTKSTNVTLMVLTSLTLIVLISCLYLGREHSLRQAFLKAGVKPRLMKSQLVQLIRLS